MAARIPYEQPTGATSHLRAEWAKAKLLAKSAAAELADPLPEIRLDQRPWWARQYRHAIIDMLHIQTTHREMFG